MFYLRPQKHGALPNVPLYTAPRTELLSLLLPNQLLVLWNSFLSLKPFASQRNSWNFSERQIFIQPLSKWLVSILSEPRLSHSQVWPNPNLDGFTVHITNSIGLLIFRSVSIYVALSTYFPIFILPHRPTSFRCSDVWCVSGCSGFRPKSHILYNDRPFWRSSALVRYYFF